jgi:hypothetical protein
MRMFPVEYRKANDPFNHMKVADTVKATTKTMALAAKAVQKTLT